MVLRNANDQGFSFYTVILSPDEDKIVNIKCFPYLHQRTLGFWALKYVVVVEYKSCPSNIENLGSGIVNTSSWFGIFIAIAENPKKKQLSVIFQCERKKNRQHFLLTFRQPAAPVTILQFSMVRAFVLEFNRNWWQHSIRLTVYSANRTTSEDHSSLPTFLHRLYGFFTNQHEPFSYIFLAPVRSTSHANAKLSPLELFCEHRQLDVFQK